MSDEANDQHIEAMFLALMAVLPAFIADRYALVQGGDTTEQEAWTLIESLPEDPVALPVPRWCDDSAKLALWGLSLASRAEEAGLPVRFYLRTAREAVAPSGGHEGAPEVEAAIMVRRIS